MLKSLKILFVLQNDLLGGAEQLLKSLSEEYSKSGKEVHVIIMRSPMQKNWDNLKDNMKITYLNSNSYFLGIFKLMLFLIPYSKKNNFDLTLSSNININSVLGLLKKLRLLKTKKLIIRETTSVFLRIKGVKKKIHVLKYIVGYSGADLVVCQTDLMKQQFLDNLKLSHKWKMLDIQNPIDFENVLKLSNENYTKYNNEGRRFLVSAGRFIPEKGFENLIKAFNEISKSDPELDLIILGDGGLKESYLNLSNQLGISEKVIFPGFQKNPMPYFKHAIGCVVSSSFEGFPNVLLQMASLNNKVVSTLCAGNIENIPAIYICQTNQVDNLKNKITQALNSDFPQTEIFKKEEFLKNLSIGNYIEKLHEAIN